jgi:hypothetical protein
MQDKSLVSTYAHSGKLGSLPMLFAIAGIPTILIMSVIYAYLDVYIPIGGYVTLLLVIGFAAGIGMAIAVIGKMSKCRNQAAMVLFGAIGGLIAIWASWTVFVYALVAKEPGSSVTLSFFLFHPGNTWEMIERINEHGWFTIRKMTPSGAGLWMLWAIEAGAIILGSVHLAKSAIVNEMFCEKCTTWCQGVETKYLQITDEQKGKKVGRIDAAGLLYLQPIPAKIFPCIQADLLQCPQCKTSIGLRYSRLTETVDKKGERSQKAEVVPGIVIPPQG